MYIYSLFRMPPKRKQPEPDTEEDDKSCWQFLPDVISSKIATECYEFYKTKVLAKTDNKASEFKLFGKVVKEPRLVVVAYKGDSKSRDKDPYMKKVKHYIEWEEWGDTLVKLEDVAVLYIKKTDGKEVKFKKAVINYYRTGADYVSWHNDKDSLEGYIASLSFGFTRRFRIRKNKGKVVDEFDMENGSLIIMRPGMQMFYEHMVKPDKNSMGGRINITFRE